MKLNLPFLLLIVVARGARYSDHSPDLSSHFQKDHQHHSSDVTSSPLLSSHSQNQQYHQQQLPFNLVTVDMVDILWSSLNQTAGNRTYARSAMCAACSRGFTLLRFATLPFWPNDVRSALVTDPDIYWSALDGVIEDAKGCGCFLLATLFWNVFAVPDVYNESLGSVISADPNSSSRARAAQDSYITAITARYASDPTIAVWETSNEINLYFDLNMSQQQPCISPPSGSPSMRTLADNVSTAVSLEWQARVAGLIKLHDPLKRPVSSGHSVMRPDAKWLRENYANSNPPPPRTLDTRDEFINASISSALGCDWMSLHLYPGADCARWGETNTYSTVVAEAGLEAAQTANLVFHFGEFGDNLQTSPQRNFTKAVLATLSTWPRSNWIASVWDWMLLQQTDTFSIFPDRDAEIIGDMIAFNKR